MLGDLEATLASDTAALGHISLATDIHAASSMPGNPSGTEDVAASKTQKGTAADYLATLHNSDGFLSLGTNLEEYVINRCLVDRFMTSLHPWNVARVKLDYMG